MFEGASEVVNRRRPLAVTLGHYLTRLARRAEAAAVRLAFPGVCGLCGGGGQWHRGRAGLDLCEHCEAALPRLDEWQHGAGGAIHAAFDYRPPADFMIRQLKFGGDRSFARTLGRLMAEQRLASGASLPDALVPVPLHLERLRERGYNQALELARFMSRPLRCPVLAHALLRTRVTQAQSGLPAAARAANVDGCFAVAARYAEAVCGRRLALVDDVLTTGSTALEAARCLRAAGAESVEIWVACRAGRRHARKKGGEPEGPPP